MTAAKRQREEEKRQRETKRSKEEANLANTWAATHSQEQTPEAVLSWESEVVFV